MKQAGELLQEGGMINRARKDLPVIDPGSFVLWLYEKASSSLSADQVERVREGAADMAETAARNAADVVDGIACLVAADRDVGSFSNRESVTPLLFHLGTTFSQISGLLAVASAAENDLAFGNRIAVEK